MKLLNLSLLLTVFMVTNTSFAEDTSEFEPVVVVVTEEEGPNESFTDEGLEFTPMLTCRHEGFDFDEVNYELQISTYMGVKITDTISSEVLTYQTSWPIPSISKVVGTAFGDSGFIDVGEHLSYRFVTAFVPYQLNDTDFDDVDKYNDWVTSFKFTFVEITENLDKKIEVSMIIKDRPVIFSECEAHILPSSIYPFPSN